MEQKKEKGADGIIVNICGFNSDEPLYKEILREYNIIKIKIGE